MSSELPMTARLALIEELLLAIGENTRIKISKIAKIDAYNLIKSIIYNEQFGCQATQILPQVLRKYPIWGKIKIFLKNVDTRCGNRYCGCQKHKHTGYSHTGACTSIRGTFIEGIWKPVTCNCTAFIQREFKEK